MRFSNNYDEDVRQSELQSKIFISRLLTSVIFPYTSIAWNSFLTKSTIASLIEIQLITTLANPIIASLDLYGRFSRHVMAPLVSYTQAEYNRCWSGSYWTLAEKYTGKVNL